MIKPTYPNSSNENNFLLNLSNSEKDINLSNPNTSNNTPIQTDANRLILKFNFQNINNPPTNLNLSKSSFLSKHSNNDNNNNSIQNQNNDNSICNTLFKSNDIPFKKPNPPYIKISPPNPSNPTHQRYINYSSHRNNLKQSSVNDNIFTSSTKHSVNAIISLIHNNYNDIVEYDTLSSHKDKSNKCNDKDNYIESSGYNNNKSINIRYHPKQSYKFINVNGKNVNVSNTTCSTFTNMKITAKQLFMLNDLSMYNLLYLLYNEYNTFIKYSTPLKEKITTSLSNIFDPIISSFKYQYNNYLDLIEYSFHYSQFKKGKYIYPLFDLILKAKIHNIDMNYCYSFNYEFIMEQGNTNIPYTETFKFDSSLHNKTISFWLMSEIEEYKGTIIRTCYTQQIFPFNLNDIIVFRINIFNVNGKIIPHSIKFNSLYKEKIYNTKTKCVGYIEYEKGFNDAMIIREAFDSLRHCEIEKMIHIWKSIRMIKKCTIVEHIQSIFGVCFDIENVWYDVVKFYVYKFRLRARDVGVVCKNRYINYDIEVVNDDDVIINEAVCLGVLNVKVNLQKIMIRKGNVCVLYITSLN